MNHIKTFLFLILCALFLSACGKAENTSTSNSSKKEESIETKEKLNVKITLDKEITNNKIIILSGKSNLPKGTKLRIRLELKNSHKNSVVNSTVQKDGSFSINSLMKMTMYLMMGNILYMSKHYRFLNKLKLSKKFLETMVLT